MVIKLDLPVQFSQSVLKACGYLILYKKNECKSFLGNIYLPWAATESRADGKRAFFGFGGGGRSKERLDEDFDVPGGPKGYSAKDL